MEFGYLENLWFTCVIASIRSHFECVTVNTRISPAGLKYFFIFLDGGLYEGGLYSRGLYEGGGLIKL